VELKWSHKFVPPQKSCNGKRLPAANGNSAIKLLEMKLSDWERDGGHGRELGHRNQLHCPRNGCCAH